MNMLHRIRGNSGRLARVNLTLFTLVWLSIAAAPCVLAMQLGADQSHEHQCPHCPPQPCHEVQPDDCDPPDSLDSVRTLDSSQSVAALLPATAFDGVFEPRPAAVDRAAARPPARAGPRAHLLHVQFNE